MRQVKADRRSQRTRLLLMQALIDLIRTKRYDAITVQEITEHANVGRSTFYAHFTDKDDLLVDGVRALVDNLRLSTASAAADFPSLALFQHVGSHADLYLVMARGRSLALFLDTLHQELTTVFARRLAARVPAGATPAVPLPLLATMTAGMLITALRHWLEAGITPPAETVDRAYRTAADAAVRAGLQLTP
jgi:AcrR family transcriptional regulator